MSACEHESLVIKAGATIPATMDERGNVMPSEQPGFINLRVAVCSDCGLHKVLDDTERLAILNALSYGDGYAI